MNFFRNILVLTMCVSLIILPGCAATRSKQVQNTPQMTAEQTEAYVMSRLTQKVGILLDDRQEFIIHRTGHDNHQSYEEFLKAMNSGKAPDGTTNNVTKHFVAFIHPVLAQKGYSADLEAFFKELWFKCVKQGLTGENKYVSPKTGKTKSMKLYAMEFVFDPNIAAQQMQQEQPVQQQRVQQEKESLGTTILKRVGVGLLSSGLSFGIGYGAYSLFHR